MILYAKKALYYLALFIIWPSPHTPFTYLLEEEF